MKRFWTAFLLSGVAAVFMVSASNQDNNYPARSKNRMTEIELGRMLFMDPILSQDSSISCSSCHIPQFAFADTVAFSKGVGGRLGKRNAPSVMNMDSRDLVFWDGRAKNLEDQVHFPIQDRNEMNLPYNVAVMRVRNSQMYQYLFKKIYHKLPDSANVAKAIAAFERSLETGNTPHDRWMNDDTLNGRGMTALQIKGREIFRGDKAKCFECHFSPDFTGDEFRNIGLFNGKELNDSGRYVVTRKAEDLGRFRVPGLRNVSMTAPYMHDGRFKTLREVLNYYNNPTQFVHGAQNVDTLLQKPLGLTPYELDALESFLHALTDDRFKR